MKKIAVVLSGCGVFDGAEIHESVLTLLRIAQQGASYQCMAPNMDQLHVINHFKGAVSEGETRNVLVEAARIARGDIIDLATANAEDYAALIIPGGFGAAKNLSDFALKGADCAVHPDLQRFAKAFQAAGKPVGLICIAPAMTPLLFGAGAHCTIGSDEDTAAAIEAMGAQHENCTVFETCVDNERKLVTTPAYMLAGSITEAAAGINKLVDEVLAMT